MNRNTIIGLILVAAGVAGFWFGALPFKHEEEVVKLGGLRIKGQVDEVEIPKAVSAGAVALGAVFLVLGRKK
jgi:hypothetical protein